MRRYALGFLSSLALLLGTAGRAGAQNVIADSFDDWSTTGEQGPEWFNGYFSLTDDEANADGMYEADDFLEFINDSVVGSRFSRYKTPAFVNLDWTPTFTPVLLRKDLDLGLKAAKELGVSLPATQVAREQVDKLVQAGHTDCDFAILIEQAAKAAGMTLTPENISVDDGLKKRSA